MQVLSFRLHALRMEMTDPDFNSIGWYAVPSHGARPVHLIITMIKWTRTSRLSIKTCLSCRALSADASLQCTSNSLSVSGLSLTHSHALSHTLSHTLSRTLSHSLTHSHTLSHTHSHTRRALSADASLQCTSNSLSVTVSTLNHKP